MLITRFSFSENGETFLSIHRVLLINSYFYEQYLGFWNDFREVYPHVPKLQAGKRLFLNDDTFRALTTVHYRAAKDLREILISESNGCRGHILAPGQPIDPVPSELVPTSPPPLLQEGDHAASFRWVHDSQYRASVRQIRYEAQN